MQKKKDQNKTKQKSKKQKTKTKQNKKVWLNFGRNKDAPIREIVLFALVGSSNLHD